MGRRSPHNSPVEVFGVDSGYWKHHVTLEAEAKEPLAAGPRLFYAMEGLTQGEPEDQIVSRTVKAVKMGSDEVLWERPIRGRQVPSSGRR